MENTLDTLIEEGKIIRKDIKYVPSHPNVIRMFSQYELLDNSQYEIWKNKTIRFLSYHYEKDRCVSDFESAVKEFEKDHYDPKVFDKLIGVLESCKFIPSLKTETHSSLETNNSRHNPINININQSQTQTQTQAQQLAIEYFLEAMNDALTGSQQKELKAIISTEKDSKKAKSKIIEKLKEFGVDTVSKIIGGIITNPAIWEML